MNHRQLGRRVLRDALASLTSLATTTSAAAWALPPFIRSGGAENAQAGVVSGSAWLANLAFTCAVLWESGRHWGGRHHRAPRPAVREIRPRTSAPAPARYRPGGYVPMSQRPDPVTRVDLPPVVTQIQPRVEVWPRLLDTTENGAVLSDSNRQDQLF